MLAVMQGEGPQQSDATYGCDLRIYPWQAIDPSTGVPVDERFTWLAPGGPGAHSLPPDFPPSRVVALDGVRVLALVGPHAKAKVRFTRVIPAVRTFDGMRAKLTDVHRLSEEETRAITHRIAGAATLS